MMNSFEMLYDRYLNNNQTNKWTGIYNEHRFHKWKQIFLWIIWNVILSYFNYKKLKEVIYYVWAKRNQTVFLWNMNDVA